jgi:WD40 repeat protein
VQVSPDGKQFVTTSPDRRIRVFWFATGKLRRTYDESLEVRRTVISSMYFGATILHLVSEFYYLLTSSDIQ